MYDGLCVFEQTYIVKTGRNVELRWEEHENISNDSEPTKHLKENLVTSFHGKFCLQHQKINKFVRFSKLPKSR